MITFQNFPYPTHGTGVRGMSKWTIFFNTVNIILIAKGPEDPVQSNVLKESSNELGKKIFFDTIIVFRTLSPNHYILFATLFSLKSNKIPNKVLS